MLSLALVFAAYLLVDGVFGIISAVRAARSHERWGWLPAEGILNIIMGVIAAVFPVAAVLGFVLVTAAWAFLSGGAMLVAAFEMHISHGRWWMVLGGIVSLIWGVMLVIAPLIGAVVLTWWLGAYATVFGVTLLVASFHLRSQRTAARGSGMIHRGWRIAPEAGVRSRQQGGMPRPARRTAACRRRRPPADRRGPLGAASGRARAGWATG